MTGPASPELAELDRLLQTFDQEDVLEELAQFVVRQFDIARRHRETTGVDRDMRNGLYAVRGQYTPAERAVMGEDDPDLYAGITNTKVRAGRSWVMDILMNAQDKPWTVRPTPLPQLPPEAEEAVLDALEAEVKAMGGQITPQIRANAERYKAVAMAQRNKLANTVASRIESRIEDHLLEGGWRTSFDAVVMDLMQYPGAVLKGPVVERKPALKWMGSKLTAVMKDCYVVKRVSPFDFYPAPNATDPQNGTYVIERIAMSQAELFGAIGTEGFREDAIRFVLSRNQSGHRQHGTNDGVRELLEQTDNSTLAKEPDHIYDVIAYYGKIKGDMLASYGIEADPQELVEVEIWVCANQVLRAIRNPHVLGLRPFYVASFEPVPGSFWGRSLPSLLEDIQRICNATIRAMAKNMAYSAGPIGEYDANRLINEQNIEAVEPYRMYAVETDPYSPTKQQAIRFNNVPSNAQSMLQVYDHFIKQADDVSGIPAYVLGNPNVAGAGRTLGGLSMLMGNAAKGIKAVISQVDKRMIEPMIRNFYIMLMMYDPDPEIKADVEVLARGSSGLLQRELNQARALEVLQLLTPYVQMGVVPPETLLKMVRTVVASLGFDADELSLKNPDREAQLSALGTSTPQGAVLSSPAPGTPLPNLDGRSTPAPDPSLAERAPASLPATEA